MFDCSPSRSGFCSDGPSGDGRRQGHSSRHVSESPVANWAARRSSSPQRRQRESPSLWTRPSLTMPRINERHVSAIAAPVRENPIHRVNR